MHEKQETQVPALGQKDSLEESMATYSSILAWKILGRVAWQFTVHSVSKSQTRLKQMSTYKLKFV